jgi:hypothetical protein
MDEPYEGIFVARGAPEDIRVLRQDTSLAAELEPGGGKEAVIGEQAVLVFRRQYRGRPSLDALARQVARMHRGIEVAVALWRPDGMGFGVGFRRGVEWHRLDSDSPGKASRGRALSGLRETRLGRIAARRAEWFINLLSAGKLVWVM